VNYQLLSESIQKLPVSDEAKKKIPFFINRFSGPESLQSMVLVARNYLAMHRFGGFKGLASTKAEFKSLCIELVRQNNEILKSQERVGYRSGTPVKSQLHGLYSSAV